MPNQTLIREAVSPISSKFETVDYLATVLPSPITLYVRRRNQDTDNIRIELERLGKEVDVRLVPDTKQAFTVPDARSIVFLGAYHVGVIESADKEVSVVVLLDACGEPPISPAFRHYERNALAEEGVSFGVDCKIYFRKED